MRQALYETQCPGRHAAIRVDVPKQFLCFRRETRQRSTLDRLHPHDGFSVFFRHPIAVSRLNGGAVPVQIIDLELDNIHFRVGGENLVQQSCAVVIGKADFLCLSRRFQFPKECKFVELFADSVIVPVQPVKQIDIKIIYTAPLALLFKVNLAIGMGLNLPTRQLIRKDKGFPQMALHQRFPEGNFAFAVQISIGSIEISAAMR